MTEAAARRDGRRSTTAATMLRAVLDHGPVARSTVARLTGLSPAAVTRQYGTLAALGLITERAGPIAYHGVGRPHIPVDIDTERHLVGGIHVAHEHCTLVSLDLRGQVRARRVLPHTDREPAALLARAARELRDLLPGRTPLALGVATGGWVDPDEGVVVEHRSLGWRDVPVRALLTRHTGLPVHVDSHARALAQAEQLFGEARHSDSVVHLFVGNVVDAAIVTAGGTPHRGPRSAAGEVAHLPLGDPAVRCGCGRSGCFEATVADFALAERAVEAGVLARPVIADLVAAARAGSGPALDLLVARARLVGRAAALLLDVVNPDLLVITEVGVLSLPACLAAVRDEVAARSHVCADPAGTVVRSSFDPAEVLGIAAGAVPLAAVYRDPVAFAEAW
jgi:predicted NBD/HSP70 family sugar kinase